MTNSKSRGIILPRLFHMKNKKKQFHIITLFPKMFDSYLGDSIIARAIKNKKISINFYNPRDYSIDKHKQVDDKPYGGGPGMVMQVEPIVKAFQKAVGKKKNVKTLIFSPSGKQFSNAYARELASKYDHIVMISGRYEGIDARVKKITNAEEVSIGPYVLTGGELPAMVVLDAVSRHVDGVLGNSDSQEEKRNASSELYTRPEVFEYKKKKYRVPKVLLSGNHKEIEEWNKRKSKNDFLKS